VKRVNQEKTEHRDPKEALARTEITAMTELRAKKEKKDLGEILVPYQEERTGARETRG
jgi:hypothetical protein